jgi:hypothetical protein
VRLALLNNMDTKDTNELEGYSDVRIRLMVQFDAICQTLKPYEKIEVTLKDNKPGKIRINVKSQYVSDFELE